MEISNDRKMTSFACSAKWLAVACVQVGAHLVQIADDLEMAMLACPAECFIVACLQARPALMKAKNGIQAAALGSLANSSFQSGVFGAPGRSNDGNASQQNTPAN